MQAYLIGYSTSLPLLLLWLIGMGIALARWKRHPKISLLTLLALAGHLILFIINALLNIWAATRLTASANLATFYLVKGLLTSLIEAGLWAMVFYAIFAMRGEQSRFAESNYPRASAPMA